MSPQGIDWRRHVFMLGDYGAGVLTGAATAAAVRAVLGPSMDMVPAMLIGMGLGMVAHLAIGALLSPVLGAFHVMIPGSLIGTYGGMLFAMRDTMQANPGSLDRAVIIGALFGATVVAAVRTLDHALRAADSGKR